MSDDLVKRVEMLLDDLQGRIDATKLAMIQDAIDRLEELEAENGQLHKMLSRLVFCEDVEFYPGAIEKGSPYCIDFEEWHKDACNLLTGGKDEPA